VSDEHTAKSADGSADVVMYCRTWCGDCARARRWLDAHKIPYTEVDVEADPKARERAESHNDGRLHTPTFEIGEGVCVDFRPDKLCELLGIEE
jgi:mycoredoxin